MNINNNTEYKIIYIYLKTKYDSIKIRMTYTFNVEVVYCKGA